MPPRGCAACSLSADHPANRVAGGVARGRGGDELPAGRAERRRPADPDRRRVAFWPTEGAERRADLGGEELRLLPGGELAAPGGFVEVGASRRSRPMCAGPGKEGVAGSSPAEGF